MRAPVCPSASRATYAVLLLSVLGPIGCGKLFGKKEDAAADAGPKLIAAPPEKMAPPCVLGVPFGAVATGLDGELDRFSIGAAPSGAVLSMDLGVRKKDATDKEKVFWYSQRAFMDSYATADVAKGLHFTRAPAALNEEMWQESAGSALAMGDVAYSATFGQGKSVASPGWEYDYVITPRKGATWSSKERPYTNATQLASAGRYGFGIVVAVAKVMDRNREAQDVDRNRDAQTEEPKVIGRVVELVLLDAKRVLVTQTAKTTNAKEFPDAPAAAVSAMHAAAAWKTSDKVIVALIDSEGKITGSAHEVSSGDVGAPALAFKGETLYAVWGERLPGAAKTDPYTMNYVAWDTAAPTPAAKKAIAGTGSAFAPGLAATTSGLVLTWMEGDDHSGLVKMGSTASASLEEAVKNAAVISTAGANARDPEVGLSGDNGFIGWTEITKAKPHGELHVSNVTCP